MRSPSPTTLLLLSLALASAPARPCTVFMAHDAGTVLVGNNEDGPRDWTVLVFFVPPAAGSHGYVGWRYDSTGIQGGMNDRGLFWDGLATPLHEIENDTGTVPFTSSTLMDMLRLSATVDEAISYLRLHRLSETFAWSQLFLADRSGNSAVFEGDVVVEPAANYQICTNFLHSNPDLGNYPCPRYEAVQSMMETGLELTVDYFTAMAEAAHQGTDTDSAVYTRYTTVCDLVAAECSVTYDLDFDHRVLIDLEAELALGPHEVMMADLFFPPAQEEEEPEPAAEAEPDAGEDTGPEEAGEEALEEPSSDGAVDPDPVPGDPVADTEEEEGGETPEKCGGCGCRVAGSGFPDAAGGISFLLILSLLFLMTKKTEHVGRTFRCAGGPEGPPYMPVLFCLLLATACGNDCRKNVDAGVDPAADPEMDELQEADAEDSRDPDAEAEEVQEEDLSADELDENGLAFIVLEPGGADDELVPVEGATVAFDAPFRDRAERETGADGKAWFGEFEWTGAMATVSAHKDGYAIISMLNLNADSIDEADRVDGAVALLLGQIGTDVAEPVTVSGTATGLLDSSHPYVVGVLRSPLSPSQTATWSGTSTESFSVTVQRGEPFTLLGVEMEVVDSTTTRGYSQIIYRMMQQDFDAIDESLEGVVLDFEADDVTVTTADLSIAMPSRAASPLRSGNGDCAVSEKTSPSAIGWTTDFEFDPATSRMNVSFAFFRPAWAEGVVTYCWVYSEDWGSYNIFGWSGFPGEGDPDLAMDVPDWISPANPLFSVPLHSNLRWNLFDEGVGVELAVSRPGQTLWMAYPGQDATELTLPEPPSSVDWASDFGMESVYGNLTAYMLDESGRVLRFTQPQTITLAP